MPKGVLWRQHDIFMAAMGGRRMGTWEALGGYDDLADKAAAGGGLRLMILPPLMHGAAQWAAFMMIADGNILVMPDDPRRPRPRRTSGGRWPGDRVNSLTVVGDAILRPLVAELDRGRLRHLVAAGGGQRGGAADPGGPGAGPAAPPRTAHQRRRRVVGDRCPDDRPGRQAPALFAPGPGTVVLHDGLSTVLGPGPRRHRLAGPDRAGCRSATWATRTRPPAPSRWSTAPGTPIPGDRARHRADGQIELLGRDSVTINSGGEKIFAEEVERAIAGHPAVADVVASSRPSERWGQEVVAVVQLGRGPACQRPGASWTTPPTSIARYKLPKAVVFVEQLQRSPSGKADYRWAAEQARTT